MKRIFMFCFNLLMISTSAFAQVKGAHKDSVVTNFFKRTSGMIAADGGYTIMLNDGRVLWLFGDSYMDDYDPASHSVPCLFGANNSILIQPKNDWDWHHTKTLPGSKGTTSFFKAQPGNFIWPMTGFQQGDTVYILCLNLHKTGPGQYDLKNTGDTWAKIDVPTLRVVTYSPLQDFAGIGFGQGFIKDGAYIYTYGIKANKIYIARFPENKPNMRWSFWDGENWVNDVTKSASIAAAPGFSVYFTRVKDKYIYLSTEFSLACDNGKDIYAAVSTKPQGPFSVKKVIYTIDDNKQGHRPFFYGPLAHPEYINSKDELLINYSINGYAPCVPGCVDGKYDPDNYRPRGIRVPLHLIDPEL